MIAMFVWWAIPIGILIAGILSSLSERNLIPGVLGALFAGMIWLLLGLAAVFIDTSTGGHEIRTVTEAQIFSLKPTLLGPFVVGLDTKTGDFIVAEDNNKLVRVSPRNTILTYSNDAPPTYVLVRGHNKPNFWLPGKVDVDVSKKLILPTNATVENYSIE